jgi:hypothetical protein
MVFPIMDFISVIGLVEEADINKGFDKLATLPDPVRSYFNILYRHSGKIAVWVIISSEQE